MGNFDAVHELRHEKKKNYVVSEQVRHKQELHKHKRWLVARNFGFKKKSNCTIHIAKTKAMISFAVTAKLICIFVFAYAGCFLMRRLHYKASLESLNMVVRI